MSALTNVFLCSLANSYTVTKVLAVSLKYVGILVATKLVQVLQMEV